MKTNAFAFWCFVRVTSRVAAVAMLLLLTLRQLSGAIFTSSMLGDMLNPVFAENFGITTTPNLSCIVDIGSVEVGAFVHPTGLRDAGTQRDLSFTTEAGLLHSIESNDAVGSNSWNVVQGASVIGSGGNMTFLDTRPPSAAGRFYRIAVTP